MKRNHKIAIAAVVALSVIAVGGAVGATKLTPEQESEALINDAAEQLGVQPNELTAALKQALKNRVDAAVRDGRLTEEEGQRLKERIDENDMPFFGLGPTLDRHHDGPFHGPAKLEGAAEYLGMSEAQLREALEDGKTLAQVARDRGKSVEGLVDKLAEYAEQKLSDAVEEGHLTEAEKSEMLQGLRERLRDVVNGRFPVLPGPRFHHEREDAPGAFFRSGTF
jgi:outer membrane murein-binding lipoprotein Lpp